MLLTGEHDVEVADAYVGSASSVSTIVAQYQAWR